MLGRDDAALQDGTNGADGPRPSRVLADRLAAELLPGLGVGERLPTERAIAQRFGVGRTIVREAVLILELRGLVTVRKASGARRAEPPGPPPEPEERIGPFELIQARVVIESAVTELAARTLTAADLKRLRAALDAHVAALAGPLDDAAHEAIARHDVAFHLALAEATHNDALIRSVRFVRTYRGDTEEWRVFLGIVERDRAQLEMARAEHEAILERLAARDVDGARDAMRRHIHRKSGRLREELDRRGVVLDTRLFDTALLPEPTEPSRRSLERLR